MAGKQSHSLGESVMRTAPTAFRLGALHFLSKGVLMTPAQRQTNPRDTWRILFNEHHDALTIAVEMLLDCRVSTDQILDKALTTLEGSPLHHNFAEIYATRAVVKAAIAHNREAANSSPIEAETADRAKHAPLGGSQISILPWSERAVYFLRGVLGYSRRDTALLLGMSDANIDQLYKFAERRIGYSATSPSPR